MDDWRRDILRLNPNAQEFVPNATPVAPHIFSHGSSGQNRSSPAFHSISIARLLNSAPSASTDQNTAPNPNVNDNLRVTLSEHLLNETHECMICCERVRWTHPVWSCHVCFNVFHLRCVKKWAGSCAVQQDDGTDLTEWRCPGCQNVCSAIPVDYFCFCGKTKNPRYSTAAQRAYGIPHSCGELCQKQRRGTDCKHLCNELCHPGPCPPCPRTVNKNCLCTKETRRVRCGSEDYQCGKLCGKKLSCGQHECDRVCHSGDCGICQIQISQNCFCGRSTREILCGQRDSVSGDGYCCEAVCDKVFSCGSHRCARPCHEDDCEKCPFDPTIMRTCCCGKYDVSELKIERVSCNDPPPTCADICGKKLSCGEENDHHTCRASCHVGPCPPCTLTTPVPCRCGLTTKNIECQQLWQHDKSHPFLCDRRCTKKRSCKQHKCGELCCVDRDHLCTLLCGRRLSCGIHTCDALCHGGKCRPCLRAGFEELSCFCGASIIYPPVPCGTKPPACDRRCTRQHACGHQVSHTCHSEPSCPPCTVLTQKWCYGKHELRKNIPCFLEDVLCGKPCGKPLACGQHVCARPCHAGACSTEEEICNQPCLRHRANCGHPCAARCHGETDCPETVCQIMLKVTCKCGLRTDKMSCPDVEKLFASRTKVSSGEFEEQSDGKEPVKMEQEDKYKCLQCNEECARIERNRRFAKALNVKTEDFAGDLTISPPTYTDFLKQQLKSSPDFVVSVERYLCDLITALEKSKQENRNHAFGTMTRDQRRFVHEYASFFGIETIAYDQEPQRNVVATAKRGKSKIPNVLLSSFVQKENGKARVAPPKTTHDEGSPAAAGSSASMKTLQFTYSTVVRR